MRIYLDSCVYQDLKKEECKELYNLIIKSKGDFLYLYSKAHLYDLSRDKYDYKFTDMEFIESIADNNSLSYDHDNKKFVYEYTTPIEHYNMYDWSGTSIEDIINSLEKNPFLNLKEIFQDTPYNLNLGDKTLDKMGDAPSSIMKLLGSSNFYDFYVAFLKSMDTLSTKELTDFRELLKYLHNLTSLHSKDLSSVIEGFDIANKKIIDKVKLRDSYVKTILGENNTDSFYNAFCKLYSGLEFYGLEKHSTVRNQHLMNFINDGKHAAYGTCVDILVSKDKDFINKTIFLYNLLDISIPVLNIEEFHTLLSNSLLKRYHFNDLIEESFNENLTIIGEEKADGKYGIQKRLNITYGGVINTITYIEDFNSNKKYISFSVENKYNLNGTIVKELKHLTSQLVIDLGIDINNNGKLDDKEIIDGKWKGRLWKYNSLNVYLNYEVFPYILIYT